MKKIIATILTMLTLFMVGCSYDEIFRAPEELEVQDFVWKAMNHWYFWQEDVIDLADTKDEDKSAYLDYLNGFNNPENLFESLKYVADDFSWYIPDVEEQLNSFNGISESYGIGLPSNLVSIDQNSDDVVIFVAYVVPGSPADAAGIKRGDLIYKVNGTILNSNNGLLVNKIYTDPTISLGIARYENGSLQPIGDDIALTAVTLSINPVHYSTIFTEGDQKIGYLVYNRFTNTYHSELNTVFTDFKNQGVNELILDLRYNPGGRVLTSAYLSSMIEGTKADGAIFASLTYNSKRNPQNETMYRFRDEAALYDKTGEFTETYIPISRLTSLNRVYVLTSRNTASASEMVINGLRPSMEVIIVGTTTVGKNEGSFTVVDAPASSERQLYTDVSRRNPNHTIGLQPIVFQIFNSLEQSDYADGFPPNIEIDELNYTANILPFGDENEVLLNAALNDITNSTKSLQQPETKASILQKVTFKKFSNAMYTMPDDIYSMN